MPAYTRTCSSHLRPLRGVFGVLNGGGGFTVLKRQNCDNVTLGGHKREEGLEIH